MGGVSFGAQLFGSVTGAVFAAIAGFVVYGTIKRTIGLRMSEEDEFDGADISIHKIGAYPEDDLRAS